jgi:septum formation protein
MSTKQTPVVKKFILASASERRRELLTEAGYTFDVIPADIDEQAFLKEGIEPAEFAEQTALAKANKIAAENPDSLVLGADTVVDFKGQIIGKARGEAHAKEITEKLFSKPHKVITGIAIVKKCDSLEVVDSATTAIYPKQMSRCQITEHIESERWKDKAGAYAIQENDEFIERIDGSFTNVIGLPMELLEKLLGKVK